jgi:hypothetical protein
MTLHRFATLTLGLLLLFAWALPSDVEARRRRRRHTPAGARHGGGGGGGGKKKVVVLSFGPAGAAARNSLARALGKKTTQIAPATYQQTASQLGVNGEEPAGIAAVCSKLKCDAVIKGEVQKQGRKVTLTVTVFNGGNGEALGKRQASVPGRRLAAAGSAIGAQCAPLVGKGKAGKAPPPKPEPVAAKPEPTPQPEPPKPEPEKVPEYKPDPEPVAKSKGKKKRGEDGEEGEGDDEGGGTVRRGYSSGRTYGGLFDASVAIGMSMRAVQMDGADKYTGGMYPEIIIRADLYPLVLATKSFARNFGLGLSYANHLSISTKDKDGTAVDSSSREFLLQLQYHWVFLDRDTSPEVTIFAGFGMRDFNLGKNSILQSFNPKFLRFGFEGFVPFATRYIGFAAGFDGRALLAVGSGENTVTYRLGSRTGGYGIAARAGLGGSMPFGLTYFLGFEFLRFSVSFAGLNAADPPVTNIDTAAGDNPNPSTMADRYIRLWAGVGYAY